MWSPNGEVWSPNKNVEFKSLQSGGVDSLYSGLQHTRLSHLSF